MIAPLPVNELLSAFDVSLASHRRALLTSLVTNGVDATTIETAMARLADEHRDWLVRTRAELHFLLRAADEL